MRQVVAELIACDVLINWKKTIIKPVRVLHALGAIFNTITNEATLSDERKLIIARIFSILLRADHLRLITWQRCLGHLAYVWPFIGAPWFMLKPLYEAQEARAVPHEAVRRANEAWIQNLKAINLRHLGDYPKILYVDATTTQIGLVFEHMYFVIPLLCELPIYWAETLAVLYAMYFAISHNLLSIHIFSDNMGAIGTVRRLRGYRLPYEIMTVLYKLKSAFTRITISYIESSENPADMPSRFRPA